MPARFGKKFLVVWVAIGLAILLVACGDSTATNSAAPAAVATPIPTTAAFPVIAGLQELQLDSATLGGLVNSGRVSGVKDAMARVYVSDDDLDKIRSNMGNALNNAGYLMFSPSSPPVVQETPLFEQNNLIRFYKKAGDLDILYAGYDIAFVKNGSPSVDLTKIVNQFKGKQSLLLAFSGTNLVSGMLSSQPTIGVITGGVQKGLGANSPTLSPSTIKPSGGT